MQRKVVSARLSYGPEKAIDALKLFAAYSVQGPPEMDLNMVYSPKGATFVMCYSGDAKNTDKVLEPIRRLGKTASEEIKVMEYVDVQSSGDQKETSADPRMAMGQYLKARFIPGIGPDLMKALADQVPKRNLSVVFATGCGKPGVKATETASPTATPPTTCCVVRAGR